ncbi:MAB_1171c family putative transporter [Streptomyces sp. NPDC058989]|uniref:MAB_1171c family putative transporter n=1 Tax=Streptomyces sp. NPDC058989 TaxID=3346686 RepID=UPI0036BEE153
MDSLIFAVSIAMTVVALWRLPGARYGDPLRHALWACSAGFAVTLWTRFPPVRDVLGQVGIVDFDALVKYLVSIGACLSLLNYSVTSYLLAGDDAPRHIAISRKIARIARRSLIAVVPLMISLFFLAVDRRQPSGDFAADHAGEWGAAAFMTCYYLYLGASAWTVAYQWTHVSRRAESLVLRTGLALGAASTWLYTLYAVVRLMYMWIAMLAPTPPNVDHIVEILGSAFNVLAAILFATGASLPTTHVAADRWRTWRSLWRLHSLRRDLTRAFPEVTFQPAGPRLREMTRLAPPLDVRLDGWVQEIGDAVDLLRHNATPRLWQAAQEASLGHADPEPAAEAHWIKAALESAVHGCRSSVPAGPLPDKPFATSRGEAFWLVRVQAAYGRLEPHQSRALLDTAGRPCQNEQLTCGMHAA